MANVVEIRFKKAGKIYSFSNAGFELSPGQLVVTETVRGLEVGKVIAVPGEIADDQLENPLKPVVRLATDEDIEQKHHICRTESQALVLCREQIEKLGLPMKCLGTEYNLDETHVTIYFSAGGRVDFRELVRELGRQLRVRVELRQIGPRDEAKLLGGFGRCGREFCCASYLSEFAPVSIKMAKEQNLPLNPLKISGVCGRLLCCLGHEYEDYRQMNEERAACVCQPEIAKIAELPANRRPVPATEPKMDIPVTVDDEENGLVTEPSKTPASGRPHGRRRRKR